MLLDPLEHHHRVALNRHVMAGVILARLAQVGDGIIRVDEARPAVAPVKRGELEVERVVVGVEQQVEAVVDHPLPAAVGRRDGVAGG